MSIESVRTAIAFLTSATHGERGAPPPLGSAAAFAAFCDGLTAVLVEALLVAGEGQPIDPTDPETADALLGLLGSLVDATGQAFVVVARTSGTDPEDLLRDLALRFENADARPGEGRSER